MIRKPQSLNARGLIGAAIALASGSALAEQAGRVSFVSGEVKATATDGSVRTLVRGAAINGGDRISTGVGRLQIRFTDGGFVSLQPNSVFGVDQYLYANKAPEESSLFFSLLQGGMRTITGAIGKVNKQSYKVRTPVATIGIRGTEYLARVDAKRLIVSVGSGFVNVYNEHGSTTGGAGQNVQAIPGQAPGFTTDAPDVQAAGPEGDVTQFVAGGENGGSGNTETQTTGDQLTADGDVALLTTGDDPIYSSDLDYVADTGGGEEPPPPPPPPPPAITVLPDDADYTVLSINNGEGFYLGGNLGSLTAAFSAEDGSPVSLEDIYESTSTFTPGTLAFSSIKTNGTVSWGEMSNGEASSSAYFMPSLIPEGQFLGYVIGKAVTPTFTGKATYALLGGTPARLNGGTAGTLDSLNLTLNLALGTADVDMLVQMSGEDITASQQGIFLYGNNGYKFSLYGISTSSSGSFCASSSCYTDISGFFSGNNGNQLGLGYKISNTNGDAITGTAGLGMTTAPTNITLTAGYSLLSTGGGAYDGSITAAFNPDKSINLLINDCGECSGAFEPGTLQVLNFGQSSFLSWGEYTNGEASTRSLGGMPTELASGIFEAYIIGKRDSADALQGALVVSYAMSPGNGTARIDSATSATLTSFAMDLNLAIGTIDLLMVIDIPTLNEVVTAGALGMNMPLLSSNEYTGWFELGAAQGLYATSSNNIFCNASSGCDTAISAFFAGDSSEIGTSYKVYGQTGQIISGTAALSQTGKTTDTAAPLQSGPGFVLAAAYDSLSILKGGDPFGSIPDSETAEATFDAAGNLQELLSFTPPEPALIALSSAPEGTQTATVGEYGSYKTLSWGRMTGTAVAFDGTLYTVDAQAVPLSVAYAVGNATAVDQWSNLNYANAGYKATYSVVGATNARDQNGNVGTLDTSATSLTLYFGSTPSLDVALSVKMDGGNSVYAANGSTSMAALGSGPATFATGLSTTLNGNACGGSGCSTAVHGFFSGVQAEQAGMSYSIVDQSSGIRSITGAAGLASGALELDTPPAQF